MHTQEVIFNQFGRIHDIIHRPTGLFYVASEPTARGDHDISIDAGMVISIGAGGQLGLGYG